MAAEALSINRQESAARIERDIETLAEPDYTCSEEAIRRYAYTPEYRNTLDYFIGELQALGFEYYEDPVGTLVARNSPKGRRCSASARTATRTATAASSTARWVWSRP